MSAAWQGRGALVNVEHDMECSNALAWDLLGCPHPLCTFAYRMYLPRECWAFGRLVNSRTLTVEWGSEGDEWAEWSGIGFCKIERSARRDSLPRTEWRGVEAAVNRAVDGPWHVHWPAVAHYHEEPR